MIEGNGSTDGIFQAVEGMLKGLPLQDCAVEQNPITGETGWKAPKGKAFRITGKFVVYSDESDAIYMSRPLDSLDLYISQHMDEYLVFLAQNNGNEEAALEDLKDDQDDDWYGTPKFFDGKWLVISPDITAPFRTDESGKTEPPSVMVKEEPVVTYEHGYFGVAEGLGPRNQPIFFIPRVGEVVWQQGFASAVIGSSRIEFIDFVDVQEEFFSPPPVEEIEIVRFPAKSTFGTSVDYASQHGLNEEERRCVMERTADFGIPFDDDILGRNGVLILREKREDDKELIGRILASVKQGVMPQNQGIVAAKTLTEAIHYKPK